MIYQFAIYGERHSATKYCRKLIENYFQIPITFDYGHKHFFHPNALPARNQTINTLFVCPVRNPYDWLVAMYKQPYHNGFYYYNIMEFMTKEWWSREEMLGPEIMLDRHIYTGERYKNVFEHRSIKLNFLYEDMPMLVYNTIVIKYEDLFYNQSQILQEISYKFSMPVCGEVIEMNKHKPHFNKINKETFNFINSNLDWTVENKIGYYPFISFDQFVQSYESQVV